MPHGSSDADDASRSVVSWLTRASILPNSQTLLEHHARLRAVSALDFELAAGGEDVTLGRGAGRGRESGVEDDL
jgi:hypothetical protein